MNVLNAIGGEEEMKRTTEIIFVPTSRAAAANGTRRQWARVFFSSSYCPAAAVRSDSNRFRFVAHALRNPTQLSKELSICCRRGLSQNGS